MGCGTWRTAPHPSWTTQDAPPAGPKMAQRCDDPAQAAWDPGVVLLSSKGEHVAPEELAERSVSRRSMLKGAAVGGAAAWGAPLILTGTADAASKAAKKCAAIASAGGDSDSACGVCAGQVPCGDACGCVIDVNGCCFCHQFVDCGSATACRRKKDCPRGWTCAFTCCGGTICVPPCSALAKLPAGYKGATSGRAA